MRPLGGATATRGLEEAFNHFTSQWVFCDEVMRAGKGADDDASTNDAGDVAGGVLVAG